MILPLFWLVVAVLVVGFLVWLIDQIPSIAEPYKTIAKGILIFVLVLYVVLVIGGMLGAGPPFPEWPRVR